MIKKYWPHFLLAIYLIVFFVSSLSMDNLELWAGKNITGIVVLVIFSALYFKNIRFSNITYTFITIFPLISTLSGYLGYGDLSLEAFNSTISLEGDVLEKLGHFSAGFYAFPLIEILRSKIKVKRDWLATVFAILIIAFVTMDYEIVEIFSAIKSGEIDITTVTNTKHALWFVQMDILAGTLGAIFASIIYLLTKRNKNK